MGKLALTLAVLFLSSLALSSCSSDFPENDVSTGDLPSEMPESNLVILLPSELEDPTGSKRPENELRTVESGEVTTVTFRPADHRLDGLSESPVGFRFPFRHRRPCRHGRRPFKQSDLTSRGREIPYGNDMILATEKLGSDSESSGDLNPRAGFHHHHHHHHHHHGEPELEEKGHTMQTTMHGDVDQDLDHHERKRFHHGHRLSEREDDEREDDERKEEKEEEEEEEVHHHRRRRHHENDEEEEVHHHHHHHHHPRHHHHEEEEEEGKGGFLMKIRRFLTDRF